MNEHNYATPHIYAIQNKVKLFRISAQSTRKNGAEIPAEIRSVMYKRKVLCGEKKDGPIPHIDFFLGMKVSVYQGNHAVAAVGVGNGSVASIIGVLPSNALYNVAEHDIILPNGDTSKILRPTQNITHLLLQLPMDAPKTFRYPGLPWNVYPLARKKFPTKLCVHVQFPVRVAFASTMHHENSRKDTGKGSCGC